jgi:iron complex outermembrane receptor protein
MINVPVNDALALRAVVSSIKHDGYTTNQVLNGGPVLKADDMNNLSGRVEALLKFSPSASWLLTYDTSRNKGVGPAVFTLEQNGTLADDRKVTTYLEPHANTRNSGVTSELKFGLDGANLTYLFGRRVSTDDLLASVPSANIDYLVLDKFTQASHEIRLNSSGTGPLQWVTGLYYSAETGKVDMPVYLGGTASSIGLPASLNALLAMPPSVCGPMACFELQTYHHNPILRDSKAAFGQATYSLASDWRIIAGLRYTKDSKSRKGEVVRFKGLSPALIYEAAVAGSKLTYKLAVEHDLSASQMAYLSLATGYKGGGFNDGNTISPTTPGYNPNMYFQPETITSLESGLKGRFLDGKLRLGAAAYYYNYSNLQVQALLNLKLLTSNAAKANVKGVEVEGVGLVSRDGRINFGLGLQSAKYDQYKTAGGTDYSGHTLDRAPTATLTLGYTHDWELDGGRMISASAGTRYTSFYNLTDPGNSSAAVPYGAISIVQPATTKSDVVLTYSGKEESWKLQAFVKNIEDKRSMASLTSASRTSQDPLLTEPRTFGLRLNAKF